MREPGLRSDRLDEQHVAAAPRARRVAVRREHADRPVLDDDRRRHDGARAERAQARRGRRATAPRAPVPRRGRRRPRCCASRAARVEPGRRSRLDRRSARAPGACHCAMTGSVAVVVAEPYEAAGRAERTPGFLDRRRERGVEVELGAQAARDRPTRSRSRASASPSASAERVRSSAIVASEASACMTPRSSAEKTRCSSVVATEMTAITPLVADQRDEGGALRAGLLRRVASSPSSSRRRRRPRSSPPRSTALAIPEGSCCEVDADGRPPVDVLASLAGEEARRPRARRRTRRSSATNPTAKSELISSRSARATPSTSEVRASSVAIRRRLSSSRSRSGEIARRAPACAERARRNAPAASPTTRAPTSGGNALPRERETVEADGKRLDWAHAGRGDCTERTAPRKADFPAASGHGSAFKRWAVRPIVRLRGAR